MVSYHIWNLPPLAARTCGLIYLGILKFRSFKSKSFNLFTVTVADPGGAAGARPPPPQGFRFFRFDIQIFRNRATSGVGAPPTRLAPPLQEILDPPLSKTCHLRPRKITLKIGHKWQKRDLINGQFGGLD